MPDVTDDSPVEVQLALGRVRGRWRIRPGNSTPSAAFLGIPYAQPPVGVRRFDAPIAPDSWDDVLDARSYAATAQRGDAGITLIPEPSIPGDNILHANVFTPDPTRRAEPLPVMVWFHGGSFTAGSTASPWYDGQAFTRDGIVTVSLGYRLGFDGFGRIPGAPSNRGVRDWIAGLEWVQHNIAAFGGDPQRITIAGQSAGGGAVLTLLGLPAAQHLFHGAISLSAALTGVSPERAQAFTTRMARRLGVTPDRTGFSSMPEAAVLATQERASRTGLRGVRTLMAEGLGLGPTIDGDLITEPPLTALARGTDKPLLLGATDDEFSMIVRPYAPVLDRLPLGMLLRPFRLSPSVRTAYAAANRDVLTRGRSALLGRLISDAMFRRTVPAVRAARPAGTTWTYRMTYASPAHRAAIHCVDVPFFFDCLDQPEVEALAGSTAPQELADEIHGAAVSFIRDARPGWDATETRLFGAGRDAPVAEAFASLYSVTS